MKDILAAGMEQKNMHMDNILRVKNLSKYYSVKNKKLFKNKQYIKAVDNVSLDVKRSETLGIVGESGSGKSTMGKTILKLTEPTKGKVFFKGNNIFDMKKNELRNLRKDIQFIFQDPFSSLNPRMKIKDLIIEPLNFHNVGNKSTREKMAKKIIEKVGLNIDVFSKFPHEFSGGQRQRIGIARALILNPSFIICDEAVSALDVSTQSQIINLLMKLQKDMGLTYMFISHDLSVIKHISDRVAVMYLGKIVEIGRVDDIFNHPKHPYTKALLSANLSLDPTIKQKRIILKGEIPNAINLPNGCRFYTRCQDKRNICEKLESDLINIGNNHFVACQFYNNEN